MNDDNNVKVGARKLHLSVTRMKKLRSEIKAGEAGADVGITSSVPMSLRPWAHDNFEK